MTTAQRRTAFPSRIHRVLALAAALGVGASLAGCGAQEGPDAQASATSSAAGTLATDAPGSSQTATAAPGTAAAPPAATTAPANATAAAPSLCTAASLTGSLKDPEAAAGQVYLKLVLTNTSTAACILDGYPGVSMIMAGTTEPLGEPAVRDAEAPSAGPITLAPGNAAAARMHYTQAGNYQECQQVPAQSILVYPPSATDSLEIPHPLTACSNAGINLLTIGAFQP